MTLDQQVRRIIDLAFSEDQKDITTGLLFGPRDRLKARIISKEPGVICGVLFAALAIRRLDPRARVKILKRDGARVKAGDAVLEAEGRARSLLSAERKALNFLQHLSGVATLTSRFVRAVKGTRARIYDTRKTVPGIRLLQKYAVTCGGGKNHRLNLSELAMVKDNHLDGLGKRKGEVAGLKKRLPRGTLLEIEAKSPADVKLALRARPDIIMLDNMPVSRLKKSIAIIRRNSRAKIEVSGGVNLKNARRIARLGADRISVGALTHSAPALDLSMDVERVSRG